MTPHNPHSTMSFFTRPPLLDLLSPSNQFHFTTWKLFNPLYLFYCIPVTIHYFLVLRIIRKLKETNAFFFIFFIAGISDFLHLCTILICEFLHYTQFFPEIVFVIFVIFSYVGVFFNLLSNALLSINRFCATSVFYNTYFETRRIKIYYIFILTSSVLASIPLAALMFVFLENDWSLQAQYEKTGFFESFNVHRSILITTLITDGILGMVLSIGTMYRLRKHNINYDKSLLLVTVLHILPDTLVSLCNLDMLFQITGYSKFSNELSRMFLFFLVSFNSLTIVCTNRMVRKKYFECFVSFGKLKYELSKNRASVATVTTQAAQTSDRITIL